MPISNDDILRQVAQFKRYASKEFDRVVKELVNLVWKKGHPSENFLFEADPELDAEANEILQRLSDNLAERAKEIATSIIQGAFAGYNAEDAWEYVDDIDEAMPIITRFDMQGSHLKELLEIWIALAAVNGISRGELVVLISRHINNPYASPLWRGLPSTALRWGRGYSRNIPDQLAIIGQNAIIGAVRYAEWEEETRNGATFYVRRRGSSYDCDVCNEMANKPIPISVPFDIPHSRCCCYPEYFYDNSL